MPSLALSTRWRKRASLWSSDSSTWRRLVMSRDVIAMPSSTRTAWWRIQRFSPRSSSTCDLVLERFAGLDDLRQLVEQAALAKRGKDLAREPADEVDRAPRPRRFSPRSLSSTSRKSTIAPLAIANALAQKERVEARGDRAAKTVLENAQCCRVVTRRSDAHL